MKTSSFPFLLFTCHLPLMTGALGLHAQQDPESRIELTSIAVAEALVTIVFEDRGTGASAYRLESLPRFGNGHTWTEVEGAQAVPLSAGRFRFTVAAGSISTVFFRVRGVLSVLEDTDGDGLDDAWERLYFGSLDALASGDDDGDGYTNLQEFLAGTNPMDPSSQPSYPLVQFEEAHRKVTEGTGEVSIPLILNKPWGGVLHFAVTGSAQAGQDYLPVATALNVVADSPAVLRIQLLDNRVIEPIKWLNVRLLDSEAYAVGAIRSVTLQIDDNDQAWIGAFTSRMGRFGFGLELIQEGSEWTGRLISTGGVLPVSPKGGFALHSLTRSFAGVDAMWFDTGWLSLSEEGAFLPGVTHVRLISDDVREGEGGLFSGRAKLQMGSPVNGVVSEISGMMNLAQTASRFVAGQTRFVP